MKPQPQYKQDITNNRQQIENDLGNMKPHSKKEDREYCKRCGEDTTIIKLHTCINNEQYADYGDMIYQQKFIKVRDLVKKLKPL